MKTETTDDEILSYIKSYYDEREQKLIEDIKLFELKTQYEESPTEENGREWRDYSEAVLFRRGYIKTREVTREEAIKELGLPEQITLQKKL